jgi:hypothetical protein
MATALGLVALVVFIVAVIMLAAAITWVVVKVTPQRTQKREEAS